MKKPEKKSFIDFLAQFPTEQSCKDYFEAIRFKDGAYCPHCEAKDVYRFKDGRFRCAFCKKDFTLKTGTIFGESKIPLQKWFIAIYLLTTAKKGISSVDLAQKVGVTQKTGWFMDHRIRSAMTQDGINFNGTVEADESYFGGKEKNKHFSKRTKGTTGRSTKVKTPVFGILERKKDGEPHSRIKAKVVPNVRMVTLEKEIKGMVLEGSQLYTDRFLSYARIGIQYPHGTVDHGRGQYVDGDVHTNGIESFWAIFKRGYIGTYHHMSKKHLQKYTDEFAYRFNSRILGFEQMFEDVVSKVSKSDPLKYQSLIKSV